MEVEPPSDLCGLLRLAAARRFGEASCRLCATQTDIAYESAFLCLAFCCNGGGRPTFLAPDDHQVLGEHGEKNPVPKKKKKKVRLSMKRVFRWFAFLSYTSPRFFHRESFDSQDAAQRVLGAVHDVLLLLVEQLLLDDVLAQVEHHLATAHWQTCS